ncbi:hypothetical protein GGS26DRAFT_541829, partial [Hypomontagnella submonticulosa]
MAPAKKRDAPADAKASASKKKKGAKVDKKAPKTRGKKKLTPAEKKEKTQKHNLSDQYRTWVRGSYSDAMETAITGFLAENPVFRAEINTAITRLFKESLQAKVDKENKETMKAFHASRAGHWGFTHVLDDEEEPSDHEDSDGGDQNSQHDDDDEEEDSEDPEGVYMDC